MVVFGVNFDFLRFDIFGVRGGGVECNMNIVFGWIIYYVWVIVCFSYWGNICSVWRMSHGCRWLWCLCKERWGVE